MLIFGVIFCAFAVVRAGPSTEAAYKGQFCTDPRTMRKHAAYTEWADAYSCTRHRCQPGGRNLAIYTVGCKRVEAPESAIECEEVVEDTNMQFPYCCTRLRCLVVVRGEVWTRVLGQPWETLPAAPWSHMYKMKKPPPADGSILPNKSSSPPINQPFQGTGEGPIYELQTETETNDLEKVLRSKKGSTEAPDCNGNNELPVVRAAPAPDIVIALSTSSDKEGGVNIHKKSDVSRHKRGRKNNIILSNNNNNNQASSNYFEEDAAIEPRERAEEAEEPSLSVGEKEKPMEPASDERFFANSEPVTPKAPPKPQIAWTEIPQNQWNEHEPSMDAEAPVPREPQPYHQTEFPVQEEKKSGKPGNLQALVDAIGTRMRDIESVVQRMSEKVHDVKTSPPPQEGEFGSPERRSEDNVRDADRPHHEIKNQIKKPSPDSDQYKRFTGRTRGSKYLHGTVDGTTEQPLFVEDTNMNGYFSDASNSLIRRAPPKEPAATYMAPVENRRKGSNSEENEKKHKKRAHKKKRTKGHHKKHHGKDDKRKRFNKLNSVELDRNAVSLEDSSALASK